MARPLRLKRKQGGGSSSNLPTSDGALKVLDLSSALFAHDYGTDANLMFSCFFYCSRLQAVTLNRAMTEIADGTVRPR